MRSEGGRRSGRVSARATRSVSRSHGFHGWSFSHSLPPPPFPFFSSFSAAASSSFTSTRLFGLGFDSS